MPVFPSSSTNSEPDSQFGTIGTLFASVVVRVMTGACPKPHTQIRRWSSATNLPISIPAKTLLLVLACAVVTSSAHADSAQPAALGTPSDRAIVIGFVGGFVHHDDRRHAEVQLAEKLRAGYSGRVEVGIFENRRQEEAHLSVLKWLDSDGTGTLSDSEKRQARIILYGHSWGASAVVALARELQKDRIPVLLTIQVDSITKFGEDDHVIPANVARAVNFYQTGGALHGLHEIVPADPLQTQILGDFRLVYKKQPEPCSAYPWFARHFLKGHTSIECDPNVWSRIEALIGEYLLPAQTQAADTMIRNF